MPPLLFPSFAPASPPLSLAFLRQSPNICFCFSSQIKQNYLFNILHIFLLNLCPHSNPQTRILQFSIFFLYRRPFFTESETGDFILNLGEIWIGSWGFMVRIDRSVGRFLGFCWISNVDFLNLEVCGELGETLVSDMDLEL